MKKNNLLAALALGGAALTTGSLWAAPDASQLKLMPLLIAATDDATPSASLAGSTSPSPTQTSTPPTGTSPTQTTYGVDQSAYSNPYIAQSNSATVSPSVTTLADDYYAPQIAAQGTSKLPIHFGLALGVIYDDNISIRNTNKQSDVITVITPSLTFETGRKEEDRPTYFSLTFDPNIQFFADHSNNDSVDYHVGAVGQKSFGKLIVGLSQAYDTFNGPNIDVGNRLFSEVYTTRFYGSYPITGKIGWDWEAVQKINNYDQGYDNDEWFGDMYFDYAVTGKTRIGIGGTAGAIAFQSGFNPGSTGLVQPSNSDQTYQQGNIRVIYDYSDKLSLTAKIGGEVRQSDNGADTATPVADIGVIWKPFHATTITGNIFRRTVAAISQNNTNYDYTGADINFKQGFCRFYSANLNLAYSNSNYHNLVPTETYSGLTMNYYTIRPSLDWHPNEHFAASLYYQFQKNASTLSNRFEDNQVGISGSVAY